MRRLITGYAIRFNRRHKRLGQSSLTGRAWSIISLRTVGSTSRRHNRYKSIVCQEDIYLQELVRYIHLNPVRAGIVKTLEELKNYKYCGHSSLMGRSKRNWQDTDYVLGYFGKTKPNARRQYETFVKQGLTQGRRKELTGGGLIRSLGGWRQARERLKGIDHVMSDERILGDSDFVDSVISRSEEQ